ncbi:unnamed protein product [Haemonchus placei]|uniref:G_PROTEIN_RECEP_F1_2 domain-containing protein n=1 Tax=Haemonchus placei TaxID=6290 RepID=A0A0N4X040_HAEPC|nr:unnamed protein product [Haemonchus placei]
MVVFIFCACCMSLNVLFGKIRRMVEIRDLERKSEREAQIASIVYYNSTLAGLVLTGNVFDLLVSSLQGTYGSLMVPSRSSFGPYRY